MIARLTLVMAIAGLLLAGYFVHRGPSVSTEWRPLPWENGAIDAGTLDVQFSSAGLDFIRATDSEFGELTFAVIRRGELHFVLNDISSFFAVEHHEGRWWVACGDDGTARDGAGGGVLLLGLQLGPGGSLEVGPVPSPRVLADLESLSVRDDHITFALSADNGGELHPAYVWPWWRWEKDRRLKTGVSPAPAFLSYPTVGPGRFNVESRNGGRSWRIER